MPPVEVDVSPPLLPLVLPLVPGSPVDPVDPELPLEVEVPPLVELALALASPPVEVQR